jgi:3-dehydroquinate synthase
MDELVVAGETRVVIGREIAADPSVVLDGIDTPMIAVLTQPGPASTVGRGLARAAVRDGLTAAVRILPDAEQAKRLAVVEDAAGWLASEGATRETVVVGVGGGALTDVAGFLAAVFLRGVRAVYVPTTMLGAVDASIGGKTAVNVEGKNLIGAFRHPERVAVDLEVLERLPADRLREGLAEALKAGLIGDPALFEVLESDGIDADLGEVVRRSLAVKAEVVGRDFLETGERAVLNYGHTVGHAVEVAAGIGHGPAVAIGMVAAGRASALAAGFDAEDRQRAAIEGLGLPVATPGVRRDEVLRLLEMDKKRDAVGLRMVLLEGIGRPRVSHVDSATVDAALESVGVT